MSTTLADLRTQARQLADMEQNNFISDSELNTYINFAIADLHDLLVESYGSDYFLSSFTSVTSNGTEAYNLPADFYKLRGLDIKLDESSWTSLKPFNFNERNRYSSFGSWTITGISNIRYRIMGNTIRFVPIPDTAKQFRIWYIPVATKLVNDNDTLNDINQYSDFIVITAALKMLNKEESDTSNLAAERARIIERIKTASQNRDAGEPESISDIYAENNDYWWFVARS